MLLETLLGEDLGVVPYDVWLALNIDVLSGAVGILHLVRSEQDSLAEEVRQDIVGANELEAPIERVQDVCFLVDKLVVGEGRPDVLQELGDARVGLLVVLG